MTLKECYAILKVEPSCSLEDIKHAYRRRAFELHPDLNPQLNDAGKQFQLLNEAYVILTRLHSSHAAGARNKKQAAQEDKTSTFKRWHAWNFSFGGKEDQQQTNQSRATEDTVKRTQAETASQAASSSASSASASAQSTSQATNENQRTASASSHAERPFSNETSSAKATSQAESKNGFDANERPSRPSATNTTHAASADASFAGSFHSTENTSQHSAGASQAQHASTGTQYNTAQAQQASAANPSSEEQAARNTHFSQAEQPEKTFQQTAEAQAEGNESTTTEHAFQPSWRESSQRRSEKPRSRQQRGEHVYAEQQEVLHDILSDAFARRVFEDIYSEIRRKDDTKHTEQTASFTHAPQKEPAAQASTSGAEPAKSNWLSAGLESLGNEFSKGVGTAVKGWFRNQIDEAQTIYLPVSGLGPGRRVRLQIRRGLTDKVTTLEVCLPPDFAIGKPFRLRGMGSQIGNLRGDLYLTVLAR